MAGILSGTGNRMFLLVGNLARVVNYMTRHGFSFRKQKIVLYECRSRI